MFDFLKRLFGVMRLSAQHVFTDRSRMTYHAQFDILRYESAERPPRVLDIGLEYDDNSEKFRVSQTSEWRWRDPSVPLHTHSESGTKLTEAERQDIISKIQLFQDKHRTKFEAL